MKVDDEDKCNDDEERLQMLRRRAGAWYQLAAVLSALHKSKFDMPTIESMTGITGMIYLIFAPAMKVLLKKFQFVFDSIIAIYVAILYILLPI